MNQLAMNDFNNFLVGFDRLQDMFIHGNSRSAYPPYNLIKVKKRGEINPPSIIYALCILEQEEVVCT